MTAQPSSAATFRVVVLMPVYRDWECAAILSKALDEQLAQLPDVQPRLLLVDDGSPDGTSDWTPFRCSRFDSIELLRLRRNLGHQRAICVGVCHVFENVPCDAVLVMDSDGEDRVEDAIRLIQMARSAPGKVVFAERRKRLEGLVFRSGYRAYRMVHLLLTGIPVRVGNFSIVPYASLNRLTCMSELWNHYAAAIFKSKLRFESTPTDRGVRIKGQSHMNFSSLVAHGISAIANFSEIVATRILIASVAGLGMLFIIAAAIFGIRIFTTQAVPGWATYTTGLAMVLSLQILCIAFSLLFSLIANRTAREFIPIRDYGIFVEKVESLPGVI